MSARSRPSCSPWRSPEWAWLSAASRSTSPLPGRFRGAGRVGHFSLAPCSRCQRLSSHRRRRWIRLGVDRCPWSLLRANPRLVGGRRERNRAHTRLGLGPGAVSGGLALLARGNCANHRLRIHRHERGCVRWPGRVRRHRCITRLLSRLRGHRGPQPVRRRSSIGSPAHHDRTQPSDSRAYHYRCNPRVNSSR